MAKTKLELTWPGKEERPRLEPRILLEHPERGHHAAARREGDLFDNMLIKGDNLLALKALEQDFSGKVKCIYIDPPFNTQNDFFYYEDGMEHSRWLDLMRQRIVILRNLLSDDGILWIHIDDKEMAYLKVLCDEIIGRRNFLNMIVAKTSDPSGHKTVNPSPYSQTEYILMYARNRDHYRYEQRYVETGYDSGYNRYIENLDDDFIHWKTTGLNEHVAKTLGFDDTRTARKAMGRMGFDAQVAQFALNNASSVFQPTAISSAAGREIVRLRDKSAAQLGTVFHYPRNGYEDIYILNGRQIYFYASKLRVIDGETVPAKPLTNLWTDIPYNGIAREGGVEFKNGKKPERLVARCIELATEAGDLVLDSFAGSGTTGAVAHKMGRRWIMVEIGDHADSHIVPRLTQVIDGDDKGGVTKTVGWQGGGGFRYFTMAPSLLERDAYGNWVIAPEYNGPMLAQAMCKHLGFTYDPAQTDDSSERNAEWWRHGRSSETDFLYVTTQALTQEALRLLSDEVGPERSLLICARAFSGNIDGFENLTCRKIPSSILTKCEWGRDDYSLNIAALPERQATEGEPDLGPLFAGEPSNG